MLTFRQMQRMLHLSKGGNYYPPEKHQQEMVQLARFLSGLNPMVNDGPRDLHISQGHITTACDCSDCRNAVRDLVGGDKLKKLVDAMARKFGPSRSIQSFLNELLGRPEQMQSGGEGEPGDNQGEASDPALEKMLAQMAAAQAADQMASEGEPRSAKTDQQQSKENLDAAARQQDRRNQSVEEAKAKLEELQKKLQEATKSGEHPVVTNPLERRISQQRKDLKSRRKAASGTKMGSQPSLTARKGVSRGLGRLRRVDVKTRQRMALLINRILGMGKAGDQLTPIPVTDHRRLVKKMLSRRPLTNAFKEDSDSGRPAILFLPDISPSCAAQAQPACDIANAAGYAGVPGADVLVMPHFNGDIDSSCEEYMPWCNGRPMTLRREEQSKLFTEATSGDRFNIRAVVIVGDHDGEWLYKQMADQPKIRQIIWLHNLTAAGKPARYAGGNWFSWPQADTKKVCLVTGCINAESMMQGLEVATA